MLLYTFVMACTSLMSILAFANNLFTIKKLQFNINEAQCGAINPAPFDYKKMLIYRNELQPQIPASTSDIVMHNATYITADSNVNSSMGKDPIKSFQKMINRFLFGQKVDVSYQEKMLNAIEDTDLLAHFPQGNVMSADIFRNKTGVHLPNAELVHRGHCYLHLSKDFMQTAVNAFAIFLHGSVEDILHLPSEYVLRSARVIAMMKIAQEKLAATWTVVKDNREPASIDIHTLEMYRPLFKYVNGREMARLNLSDEEILYFIGTHPDLDRHQVGVVAGQYIQLNPHWNEPKYLNLLNNLLCGVPMFYMRHIPPNTYLQLSHQVFYHIKACDPLQRRFYLAVMTRTQVLGKSYSWSVRDVSRLGLLLSELEGADLGAIKPKAMAGITAEVMLKIPVTTLRYITDMQLRYLDHKSLNIFSRKLKIFEEQQNMFNGAPFLTINISLVFIFTIMLIL